MVFVRFQSDMEFVINGKTIGKCLVIEHDMTSLSFRFQTAVEKNEAEFFRAV